MNWKINSARVCVDIAVLALDPKPGEYSLDLCASRIKNFTIAEHLNDSGVVVATKLSGSSKSTVSICRTPFAKQYHCQPRCTSFSQGSGTCHDRILVDAPCIEIGIRARTPMYGLAETKWWTLDAELQIYTLSRATKLINRRTSCHRPVL